ncbi:methyltransferase domain-containing protein [Candidatus Bathyarchaeota archaeon]|nr:methyltransferase domain-containing protein [Candidatus Bathyarchaeota archaeon]
MSGERRRKESEDLQRDPPQLSWGDVPHSVAPYVPTPHNVVESMLTLAHASSEDVVYDLGCGDGRILMAAVEGFGAKKAVGYDLNPKMCGRVRLMVDEKGLSDRIEVVNGNFFLADLSGASLVTLYLTTSGNSKLRPKLEEELAPGSRVVSHDFPIHGWTTVKKDPPEHYVVGSHKIYVYSIPEAYEKKSSVLRSKEEDSRWRRIRDLFIREDSGRP